MSDDRRTESNALNWRGPLLAAAIFAAVFATLLLMAYQNESRTSDMGSSLREDPYGARLLFDSYGRAGYQVKRAQDENSLSDQDASRTTAFFIGGDSTYDWTANAGQPKGAEKFRRRLEDFLARGGRVVLVEPQRELKSESQGWEVGKSWNHAAPERTPTWVSPDFRSMPADTETIFLAGDGPSLETDAHWTVLYSGSADPSLIAYTSARVYMATRRAGNGELIAASQESFLLNEAIKTHPNPVLLDFLAGGRPVIWVDEALHGLHQDEGVLWLVQRYRLEGALLLFWATLLVLLWSMSGDLFRRPAANPGAHLVRHGEAAGMAAKRLLQRSIAKERILEECWEQFRRCFPQDAHAISADPLWGARLRTALVQPALAGYKEINQLVSERRASAKGLAPIDRDARGNSMQNR